MNRLVATLLVFLFFCPSALAGGINRPGGVGPKALSMGGAYTAIADDGSAFYYNLGGLVQIDDTFRQLAVDGGRTKVELELSRNFRGFSSIIDNSSSSVVIPLIAKIYRLNENVVWGWSYYSDPVATFTPAVAFQLTKTLSIGLGLDFNMAKVLHRSILQDGKSTYDEISLENKADGLGLGLRLGILWRPTDYFSWGLGYSSASKLSFDGEGKVELLGYTLFSDKFDTEFTLPSRINTGIAFKPSEKWTIAMDVNYWDYSLTKDEVVFDFDLLPPISFGLKWQNNYSFHLGAQYHLAKPWYLRGGLGWQSAAIPDAGAGSLFEPDDDTWHAGFGLGYETDRWQLNFAYVQTRSNRIFGEGQNIEPGIYKTKTHIVSVGLGLNF